MPNIYYSSPSTPFAAGTAGFLSSMEKFTKLNIDQQRTDIASKAQKDRSRQADRGQDLEQGRLDNAVAQENRLAQGFDPEASAAVIEMMHEGVMKNMPGAVALKILLQKGKIAPVKGMDLLEKWRLSEIGKQSKLNKRVDSLAYAKGEVKRLREEGFRVSPRIRELEKMVAELESESTSSDIDPWLWEDEFEAMAAEMQMISPSPEPTLGESIDLFQYIRNLGKGAPQAIKEELETLDIGALGAKKPKGNVDIPGSLEKLNDGMEKLLEDQQKLEP